MALQIDASSPAAAVGAATTVSTASFSPPANSLLVAFVMSDANSGASNEQNTVTSTGGLSWTLKARANGAPGANVEIWSAQAVSAPGSITVSVTDNQGAVDQRLFVRVFTDSGGGIPAGIGATNTSAATSVGYTSTVNGSWGWAVGLGGGGAPTAGTGQTLQDSDTNLDGGDGTWVIDQNATTTTAGTSVTMSVTAPATVIHFAAAEILPMSTATAGPTAGPWTAPAPGHVSPTGQWRVVLGDAFTQVTASASAEATTGTGVANDAAVALGVNDPGTTATGAANDAVAALAVNDPGTTGSGAANDAVGSVGAQDGGTSGSGAAQDPTSAITVTDGGATASGSAFDATVAIDWLNYAGPWTQVTPGWISPTGHLSPLLGDATVATVSATNAPAEATTATGAANDPNVAVNVNDPGTTASGAAQAPTPAVGVNDGGASATGTANDATVNTSSSTSAPAEVTTATGVAGDPSTAVTITDPGTTGSGQANDAVPALGALDGTGTAASGAANAPGITLSANDQGTSASGAAFDASVAVAVLAEVAAVLANAWDIATSAAVANGTSDAAVTGRRTGTATVTARRTSSPNVSDG